jgi:hypothetical protein
MPGPFSVAVPAQSFSLQRSIGCARFFEINQQPDSGDITDGFAAKPRRDNDEQSRSKTE